jgi:hypothetical protein
METVEISARVDSSDCERSFARNTSCSQPEHEDFHELGRDKTCAKAGAALREVSWTSTMTCWEGLRLRRWWLRGIMLASSSWLMILLVQRAH